MDTTLILAASLAGGAVLAALCAVGSMLSADRRLDSRMDFYLGAGFDPEALPEHVSDADGSPIAERLNATLDKAGVAEGIRRGLARADLPLTVPEYMLLKLAALLLPAALALIFTRSLVAAPVVAQSS